MQTEIASAAFNCSILSWAEFPESDLIWTDPPWEQKALNMFQTMMRKHTGQVQDDKIETLIEHLARLSHKNRPVFIEYSIKGHEMVLNEMIRAGHTHNENIQCLQQNGKPFLILSFNNTYTFPRNLKGFDNIKHAVEVFKPRVVFDPFAGEGQTARTFINTGVSYIGSEPNTWRFTKLQKVTG